ncbi:MAG: hypothetical protein C5B47_03250 [Verrucomicrobia bacterium]|nr:MAG: hypothetical protein C5B47_03250 [Verrucomicrobiota bacterium]
MKFGGLVLKLRIKTHQESFHMILINLGAGVALIILGVRFLRKGLDRFLGGHFIDWLRRWTDNRFTSILAGAATGALSASSTGLSILTAQMLEAGTIPATNMLAVLLGGNIGITFLSHLISFDLKDYSGIFLFFGTLGFLFCRNQKIRGAGQCVLALGLIFLAMLFIGTGAAQIGANRDFKAVLMILDQYPALLVLVALILAVLMQSSTAAIGLGVGFATSGVLPSSDFIPWVVGTNMGLAVTSLIVCWTTIEGRRLGFANLLAKCAVALLFIPAFSSGAIPVQIASLPTSHLLPIWHTLFNLIVAIAALPFLQPLLIGVKYWLVPDPEKGSLLGSQPETYLDRQALESPAIALAYATRESLRVVDDVRNGLQHLVLSEKTANVTLARNVQTAIHRVDEVSQDILFYLGQLGEGLSGYNQSWQLALINFSNELKMAADIIEGKLCDAIVKQISSPINFSAEETEIIARLFGSIIRRVDVAATLVSDRNPVRAEEYLREKSRMDLICLRAKQTRFEGLRQTDKQGLWATLSFLDIVDTLQRIDSHISSIAEWIVTENNEDKK